MAERLSLRLGSSRHLTQILGSAHVLAAAALWLAPLPAGLALAGSLALSVHLVWALRRHAWRSAAGSLIELELLDDCSISARSRAGIWEAYRVAGSSFVSPLLTVLNMRPEAGGWTRPVLIMADNVDADSFRRLRVWLRWRCRDGAQVRGAAAPGALQR
jgi:toxin CptA